MSRLDESGTQRQGSEPRRQGAWLDIVARWRTGPRGVVIIRAGGLPEAINPDLPVPPVYPPFESELFGLVFGSEVDPVVKIRSLGVREGRRVHLVRVVGQGRPVGRRVCLGQPDRGGPANGPKDEHDREDDSTDPGSVDPLVEGRIGAVEVCREEDSEPERADEQPGHSAEREGEGRRIGPQAKREGEHRYT